LAAGKANQTIIRQTRKMNTVITYSKKSTTARQILKEKLKALDLPSHELVTESPTR
jgi:hypothetical protein